MSNRRKAFDAPQSNPALKFYEWKSNEKVFQFYDKEKKENVQQGLPFRFLALDEMHVISGWNDATGSGVYSNEVKYISREPMVVKPFKGNEIARGLYKDIKEKVNAAGGRYFKSIYIMTESGELCNVKLKGAAVQAWGEFTKKNRNRLADEWVVVESTTDGKKGSVKFSIPDFKFLRSLTDQEAVMADDNFDTLEAYMESYLKKAEPEIAPGALVDDRDTIDDELPF